MFDAWYVTIDLPYSLSTQIAGPGLRVSLVSVGEEQIEGQPIEIEGRIIFPKKPYELTELVVFKPQQAGLREGSVWEVAFPSFPRPPRQKPNREMGGPLFINPRPDPS
jgi:hypothetical protein